MSTTHNYTSNAIIIKNQQLHLSNQQLEDGVIYKIIVHIFTIILTIPHIINCTNNKVKA